MITLPIQGINDAEVYQPMPMRIELPCSGPLERGIICDFAGGEASPSDTAGAWLVSAEASRESPSGGHVCKFDLFGQICRAAVQDGQEFEIGDQVRAGAGGKLNATGTGITGRALEATTETKRIIAFLAMWEQTLPL